MIKLLARARTQRGYMGNGILPSLLIFGCVVTLALKLGPDINDHRSIKNSLASLGEYYQGKDMMEVSNTDIYNQFDKYMSVNLIKSLSKDEFTVKREKQDVTVIIDYEKESPITDVASIVLHFHDELKL